MYCIRTRVPDARGEVSIVQHCKYIAFVIGSLYTRSAVCLKRLTGISVSDYVNNLFVK